MDKGWMQISSTLDVDLEPLLRDAILGLLDSKLGLVALPVSRHVHLSIVPQLLLLDLCSLPLNKRLQYVRVKPGHYGQGVSDQGE